MTVGARVIARTRDVPVPCPVCRVVTGKVHGYHVRTDVPVNGPLSGRLRQPAVNPGTPGRLLVAVQVSRRTAGRTTCVSLGGRPGPCGLVVDLDEIGGDKALVVRFAAGR